MNLAVFKEGHAHFNGSVYQCALGRTGIKQNKFEGDGASPSGTYALLEVLYRKDRHKPPKTKLPCTQIEKTSGWCDAPKDPAYNRPVSIPYQASFEALYRDDELYDFVVVTSHNSNPVKSGAGSAIFLHVTRAPEYPPTEGCIAFAVTDLLEIISLWQPQKDRLVIEEPTDSDIALAWKR